MEESRPVWFIAESIRRRKHSALRFHILSDRPLSERIRSIEDGRTDDGILITYQIWDLTRLKRIHDAVHVRDDLVVDLSGLPGGGLRALRATNDAGDYEAFLAVIPGDDLASIYTRYGSRLLEGNVRTFLGRRGNVNKGIQKTLAEEPARFFAFNNGISATASAVEIEEDGAGGVLITSATDLQIVNGAQTTASLAAALRDRKLPEGKVFVPVKLSVVAPEVGEELIPRISRYANSQNAVRASDFFANHAFHRRVEGISRRILAPAIDGSQVQTHWYYERARGQFLNDQAGMSATQKAQFLRMSPKFQVITKTDLAKVETCFALEPDTACRGAEKAFTFFAKLITDDWQQESKRAEFTDDWFREAVARMVVFRATEKVVSGAEWYEGGYRAQVVAYTCARLARLAAEVTGGGRLDYKRIWGAQGVDMIFREQIGAIGKVMMQVLRTPPREGQNITEWAKQQACREAALKRDVPIVKGFDLWVVPPDVEKSEKKDRRVAGQIDDDLRTIEAVMSIPQSEWQTLREEMRRRRLITPQDEGALRAACGDGGRIPNEIQAKRLVGLLNRAENAGVDVPSFQDASS
ncbi:AIPR protein [Tistlia consotensis]|uniref:AIPR protein n=1 Tax=Tistlia consotensis USBA 355 TaxID=560819 RepID=A0A1Y6B7I8_9PROT|nr:AIPR family protein [Tistlia consotensis]SME97047.1 AIPR protein [Tistlia consotensis USBA 355]SNR56474.1 AIPR protein [Tistlia consotensis]